MRIDCNAMLLNELVSIIAILKSISFCLTDKDTKNGQFEN